jgi:sec-independent protein translocase protein TatA
MDLGMPEILVLIVLALLLFGPSKLPALGKSMGEAIRGFKKGMKETEDEFQAAVKPKPTPPQEPQLTHGQNQQSTQETKIKNTQDT